LLLLNESLISIRFIRSCSDDYVRGKRRLVFNVNEFIKWQARVVILLADWFVRLITPAVASLFGNRPQNSAGKNEVW
jgi:hypothetical protein